jgi:hypothetical protein
MLCFVGAVNKAKPAANEKKEGQERPPTRSPSRVSERPAKEGHLDVFGGGRDPTELRDANHSTQVLAAIIARVPPVDLRREERLIDAIPILDRYVHQRV